jgi:hypothetical protein
VLGLADGEEPALDIEEGCLGARRAYVESQEQAGVHGAFKPGAC